MRDTTNSLFIGERSKDVISPALPEKAGGCELSARLYHIIEGIADRHESFELAARRLSRLADIAYGQRDYDALQEISAALAAIPYRHAQEAGQYFTALWLRRARQYDQAAELLLQLHHPRAVQTLATIHEAQGDYSQAAQKYSVALRGGDGFAVAGALVQLSAIKSQAGDHHGALDDLHKAWPIVRAVSPLHLHLWFQYHNELAVELIAVGQLDAARSAVDVAMSAPIAEAYPEWRETSDELRELERAAIVVAVPIRKPEATARPRNAVRAATSEQWPVVSSQLSPVTYHLSPVTHQACAPGIIERVKRSARDRDGPFVNPDGSQGRIEQKAEPGTSGKDWPGSLPRAPKRVTKGQQHESTEVSECQNRWSQKVCDQNHRSQGYPNEEVCQEL